MSATENHDAPKVADAAAHRRFLRRKYRATHAVQLYGPTSKDHSKYGAGGEFTGADNGFRCFAVIKVGSKWTHLCDTATQTARKVENSVWKELTKKAWVLDKRGRRICPVVE